MMLSKDPAEFTTLTPEEQTAVKEFVGGVPVWDGLGRTRRAIEFDKALRAGVLPASQNRIKKAQRMPKILSASALLILLLAGVSYCSPKSAEQKAVEVSRAREKTCNDSIMAWIEAKSAAASHLKSPSTAQFGSRNESTINPESNCTFTVTGWVDAQNSFGAKLRSRYHVHLQYHPNNDNWTYLKVDVN